MLFINSRARDMILRGGREHLSDRGRATPRRPPAVARVRGRRRRPPRPRSGSQGDRRADAGTELDVDALARFAGETLAPYKVPTVWELRTEPLPRNASGKVLKTVLVGEASAPPDDHVA